MQSVKKRLLHIVIILAVSTQTASADCNIALKLCDEALTSAEGHITSQRELIDSQEELIKKLATQRNEAYDRLGDEVGGMPWYFWSAIGVAAGVVFGQTVVFK